jgi:nucleotide-binding universal stress UspA family protein
LLDVQSFVTRGASGDEIGAHAAQHCADLIVIGSARQRTTAGATHLASRLSAAAERGVLTVPGDSPSCALRTILLPVTARTPETPALAWVTMLARSFGARVELVAVEPTSLGFWRSLTRRPPLSAALPDEVQHALRVVERSLSAAGITTSGVNAVRPALEVESWVESAECDLVVVGLPASVASQEAVLLERLRKNGTTPVLSIRASKRLAAVATHRRLDDECELSASA